ncbi:hypothetical protein OJ997_36130 [Solirubrobacter phytolaccae]|uniref:Uncharacterized protein n=1 Tax=Solirubrobacter phytolaccae TaxID=1404360 RepID=A0A9X3NGF7_9ACTN|nr:hypothetical protein [Solirubrobacter phytolaccae]MDA0185789.1 hypothetical protein [Solirubrobacter phytolaccae]
MHFRRPVYSGMVLFFMAVPLAVVWYDLRDAWIGICALVVAAVAVVLIPVDLRRNAFEMGSGQHPDSFKGSSIAIGALLPFVSLAAVGLVYLIAR